MQSDLQFFLIFLFFLWPFTPAHAYTFHLFSKHGLSHIIVNMLFFHSFKYESAASLGVESPGLLFIFCLNSHAVTFN